MKVASQTFDTKYAYDLVTTQKSKSAPSFNIISQRSDSFLTRNILVI